MFTLLNGGGPGASSGASDPCSSVGAALHFQNKALNLSDALWSHTQRFVTKLKPKLSSHVS